ncbi:hypothetical protein BDW42DRAFT_173126 [Aspergillus taichungensis]|uniref:Uncharacterized protein n=1 Tax=Aspergillus taichungensis TaxID=482145 RepID=A0A2J5HPY5_9EURO|nr:hypothetical protein BDW42DRAFT_173126 [Aspergillus taichungensis]
MHAPQIISQPHLSNGSSRTFSCLGAPRGLFMYCLVEGYGFRNRKRVIRGKASQCLTLQWS